MKKDEKKRKNLQSVISETCGSYKQSLESLWANMNETTAYISDRSGLDQIGLNEVKFVLAFFRFKI